MKKRINSVSLFTVKLFKRFLRGDQKEVSGGLTGSILRNCTIEGPQMSYLLPNDCCQLEIILLFRWKMLLFYCGIMLYCNPIQNTKKDNIVYGLDTERKTIVLTFWPISFKTRWFWCFSFCLHSTLKQVLIWILEKKNLSILSIKVKWICNFQVTSFIGYWSWKGNLYDTNFSSQCLVFFHVYVKYLNIKSPYLFTNKLFCILNHLIWI